MSIIAKICGETQIREDALTGEDSAVGFMTSIINLLHILLSSDLARDNARRTFSLVAPRDKTFSIKRSINLWDVSVPPKEPEKKFNRSYRNKMHPFTPWFLPLFIHFIC